MIGLLVGWMDGQAQSECVHPVAFGKGEGWAQGQCQRSTWRVAPSSWPQETVGAPGNPPRRRPARSRRGLPGNDRLAGCVHAERGRCRRNDPPNEVSRDPASVDLGTSKAPKLQSSKAPKLVQFPPVALLGGPERLAQRRETRGSSCLQPVAWRGAARPVEHPLDSPQARASGLDGTPPAALRPGAVPRLLGASAVRHFGETILVDEPPDVFHGQPQNVPCFRGRLWIQDAVGNGNMRLRCRRGTEKYRADQQHCAEQFNEWNPTCTNEAPPVFSAPRCHRRFPSLCPARQSGFPPRPCSTDGRNMACPTHRPTRL